MQDPALALVEPHTTAHDPACPDPTAEPSRPPADQHPALHSVICKLAEGALDPCVQVVEDIKHIKHIKQILS